MEARRIVGWNVRRIRVAKAVTIEELADRAGVDASTIARIERGTINTSIGAVEKIARALDVKFAELAIEPPKGTKAPRPLPAGRRPSKRAGGDKKKE